MKALVYNGPRDVSIEEVADPKIEQPTAAGAKKSKRAAAWKR
jgi:hypothetical protein